MPASKCRAGREACVALTGGAVADVARRGDFWRGARGAGLAAACVGAAASAMTPGVEGAAGAGVGAGRCRVFRGGPECLVGPGDGVPDGAGDGVLVVGVADGVGDGVPVGVDDGVGDDVGDGVPVAVADGVGDGERLLGAGDDPAGWMKATATTAAPG